MLIILFCLAAGHIYCANFPQVTLLRNIMFSLHIYFSNLQLSHFGTSTVLFIANTESRCALNAKCISLMCAVDLSRSQLEEWECAIMRECEQLRLDQQAAQETDSEDESDSQHEQGEPVAHLLPTGADYYYMALF
jgi:hypothetical protein